MNLRSKETSTTPLILCFPFKISMVVSLPRRRAGGGPCLARHQSQELCHQANMALGFLVKRLSPVPHFPFLVIFLFFFLTSNTLFSALGLPMSMTSNLFIISAAATCIELQFIPSTPCVPDDGVSDTATSSQSPPRPTPDKTSSQISGLCLC